MGLGLVTLPSLLNLLLLGRGADGKEEVFCGVAPQAGIVGGTSASLASGDIHPVWLPAVNASFPNGLHCTITGWGNSHNSGLCSSGQVDPWRPYSLNSPNYPGLRNLLVERFDLAMATPFSKIFRAPRMGSICLGRVCGPWKKRKKKRDKGKREGT
ncbi:uncharacterized protein ACOB8E_021849 isoform 1-T1 [Sarcophilus harrisii]